MFLHIITLANLEANALSNHKEEKVLAFLTELRLWLNTHKQAAAENVIRHFNRILPGWSNHYKHVVSKQTLSYVSCEIWKMLWKWCLRRHPNKGKHWVAQKYFGQHANEYWRFQAYDGKQTIYLFDVSSVKIERHIKVKGNASPDDPTLREYWQIREDRRKARSRQRKVTRKARLQTGLEARAG